MKLHSYRISFLAATLSLPMLAMTAGTAWADDQPVKAPGATADAKAAAKDEKKKGQRLISVVLLLREPRKLTHGEIAHAVSEGTGEKIGEEDVITKETYHLVKVGADKFIVNNIGKPYFDKADKLAEEIQHPDLSRAVKDSKAWVSVDWVGKDDKADLKHIYQHIGKMIAHLASKDTVAVYSPDMDEFALWTLATRKGLESDDPLAVFNSVSEPEKKTAK